MKKILMFLLIIGIASYVSASDKNYVLTDFSSMAFTYNCTNYASKDCNCSVVATGMQCFFNSTYVAHSNQYPLMLNFNGVNSDTTILPYYNISTVYTINPAGTGSAFGIMAGTVDASLKSACFLAQKCPLSTAVTCTGNYCNGAYMWLNNFDTVSQNLTAANMTLSVPHTVISEHWINAPNDYNMYLDGKWIRHVVNTVNASVNAFGVLQPHFGLDYTGDSPLTGAYNVTFNSITVVSTDGATTTTTTTTTTTLPYSGKCFQVKDGNTAANIPNATVTITYNNGLFSIPQYFYTDASGFMNYTVVPYLLYNVDVEALPNYLIQRKYTNTPLYILPDKCNPLLIVSSNNITLKNLSVYVNVYNNPTWAANNNYINAYTCNDISDYGQSPYNEVDISNRCTSLFFHNSDYWNFTVSNLILSKSDFGLSMIIFDRYSGGTGNNDNDTDLLYFSTTNSNERVTLNLGNTLNVVYNECFNFIDSIYNTPKIVNYRVSGGHLTTNLIGTDSTICFNATNINDNYYAACSIENYTCDNNAGNPYIFTLQQLSKNIYVIQNPNTYNNTQNTTYRFNATGYILDSLTNAPIQGTITETECSSNQYVNTVNGYYTITGIPYRCTPNFIVSAPDYLSENKRFTSPIINNYVHNYTLTKDVGQYDKLGFSIDELKSDGSFGPLKNTYVKVKCDGYSDLNCITFDDYCVIDRLPKGANCRYTLTNPLHDTISDISIKQSDINIGVIYMDMVRSGEVTGECTLVGSIFIKNGSIKSLSLMNGQPINILYADGTTRANINSIMGFFSVSLDCGQQFHIVSTYGNITALNTVFMSNAESGYVTTELVFDITPSEGNNPIGRSTLDSIFWTLVSIVILILLLFGLFILLSMMDALMNIGGKGKRR